MEVVRLKCTVVRVRRRSRMRLPDICRIDRGAQGENIVIGVDGMAKRVKRVVQEFFGCRPSVWIYFAILTTTVFSIGAVHAQSPSAKLELESTTLDVGELVLGQLVYINLGKPTQSPKLTAPQGVEIELTQDAPAYSSNTQIINGRISQSVMYRYSVRVKGVQEGVYKLGPFTAVGQDASAKTDVVEVSVQKLDQPKGGQGDQFIFADLVVQPKEVFVTESIHATLTVGIRKLEFNNQVQEVDDLLGSVLDGRSTQIGTFATRKPRRTQQWFADAAGVRHEYEVYRYDQDLRAEEVGDVTIGPFLIRANYPTALRRGFFGGLEVATARREQAKAEGVVIHVKSPPDEGRPASYKGAIGTFSIAASAKPERVELGQPVTLSLAVRGTHLGGVAAPDLRSQPEMVSRFDFTNEEIPGEFEQQVKVFRRAIFPKQLGEQSIPSLEWSFFDPKQEKYTVLRTEPIDLRVDPPQQGGVAAQRSGVGDDGAAKLKTLRAGISPNYSSDLLLVTSQPWSLTPPLAALLACPPLALAAATVYSGLRSHAKRNASRIRRKGAHRAAKRKIKIAMAATTDEARLSGLAEALEGYLSDKLNLSPGQWALHDVASMLKEKRVDEATVVQTGSFLERAATAKYSGGSSAEFHGANIAGDLRRWIRRLERTIR